MADPREEFVGGFVAALESALAKSDPGELRLAAEDQAALGRVLTGLSVQQRELAVATVVKMAEQLHAAKQLTAGKQLLKLIEPLRAP